MRADFLLVEGLAKRRRAGHWGGGVSAGAVCKQNMNHPELWKAGWAIGR